ncbi:hypothetical protein FA10DRAFT_264765 [Acaromyces ingoldii]|uniref:Uncharacterized protein n=1 Tax=Acaromyces ingoldii TaxID=215250 RepID=A0A316YY67_9BASI|nr:hypothetical protein FA10DRAFT_264765 [Acaromyces ingoldii]PWN94199.1 hypothetical protein FA10DRAFT_264765 [Acaromyces ingoldii]
MKFLNLLPIFLVTFSSCSASEQLGCAIGEMCCTCMHPYDLSFPTACFPQKHCYVTTACDSMTRCTRPCYNDTGCKYTSK